MFEDRTPDAALSAENQWQFQREQFLEDFVCQHLEALLRLKPLARQQTVKGQVCDILAVNPQGQLIILELKNSEDRYVVQQLTRYYDAILNERPFPHEVDYRLPIRLIAILPVIHPHNRIDQTYSRLEIELFQFKITTDERALQFELNSGSEVVSRVAIPPQFQQHLTQEESAAILPLPPPPPRSFRKLIEPLSPEQQTDLLAIRAQFLAVDPDMGEVGRTVTTQYGLKKGEREIYQSRLLAEFSRWLPTSTAPKLCLRLPYPKRRGTGVGRTQVNKSGLVWGVVRLGPDWQTDSQIEGLSVYLGKISTRPSQILSLGQYAAIYQQLTGDQREFYKLNDLIVVAIEAWQAIESK